MAQMMCNRIWDMNPFESSNPVSAETRNTWWQFGSTRQMLTTQEPT